MWVDEKAPYEAKAQVDKERYKRDMLEFNRGGAGGGQQRMDLMMSRGHQA